MLLPVNYRPVFGGDEALVENVIGNLGQTIKFKFVQFDALGGSRVSGVAVKIDVAEPETGWYVLFKVRLMTLNTYSWTPVILTNEELQSGLWSLANTLLEEVEDGVAWFNNTTVFAFPTSERSELGLDVTLAENLNDMNNFDQ